MQNWQNGETTKLLFYAVESQWEIIIHIQAASVLSTLLLVCDICAIGYSLCAGDLIVFNLVAINAIHPRKRKIHRNKQKQICFIWWMWNRHLEIEIFW